jgi:uncharacterized protein
LHAIGQLTRGHSAAEDLRASMRHGTIRGLSIGFPTPNQAAFERKASGGRLINEIKLIEISFTHNPSDRNAVVDSFKSEVAAIASLADMETFLRDAGNLSRSMATTLVSQMKTLCQSDSGKQEMKEMVSLLTALDSLKKLTK